MPTADPLARYRALVAQVDAFEPRVQAAQGAWLSCQRGCDACCRTRRTAWLIELVAIAEHLAEQGPEAITRLQARRGAPEVVAGERCLYLEADGACAIYDARPILCRTHGPAVLTGEGLAWCGLNFKGLDPEEVGDQVPDDGVLDLGRLNELLTLVNAEFQGGLDQATRGDLDQALDLLIIDEGP